MFRRWMAAVLPCLALFGLCSSYPLEPELARSGGTHGKPPKVCAPYVVTLDDHDKTLSQVGDTTFSTATVTHCEGVTAPNVLMTWTSRDATIASVASVRSLTATITAVGSGSVYIETESDGGGADSVLITVSGCTPTATFLCPGDNIQTKVTAQPSGTAFTFGAGTFRFATFTPKSNDTFTGAANHATILDGGRTLTGWTVSGSTWYVGGQTQQGNVSSSGTCQAISLGDTQDYPMCQAPEQLWMDSTVKRPVASLGAVTAGTWYFDYTADRIYVGDDPTGRLVETSVSNNGILPGSTNGVTISGFTLRHYAIDDFNGGAISVGTGWTVTNNVVVDNSHKGIRIDQFNDATVSDNIMSRNGQLGFSASGPTASGNYLTGTSVLRNHIDSNNTAGWRRQFAAGAMKITKSSALNFTGNLAYGNNGNGFWWDIDNLNANIVSDTAKFNAGSGFFYEISWGCTMTNLVSTNNGSNPTDAQQNGSGIVISASPTCTVTGSTISNNAHGIVLFQQDRGSGDLGVHVIKNTDIHNNSITQTTSGRNGFVGGFDITNVTSNYGNSWENNHYTITSFGGSNFFYAGGSSVTDNTWQVTDGFDDVAGGGTITRN